LMHYIFVKAIKKKIDDYLNELFFLFFF